MKQVIIVLGMLCSIACAQVKNTDTFDQDIVTVFMPNSGLPEAAVTRLFFDKNKNPVAVTSEGNYVYLNKSWQDYPEKVIIPQKKNPGNIPEEGGKIFCTVDYKGDTVVGTENGLFINKKGNSNWIRLLPKDGKYSWALTNVKVIQVDSNERLWFGADEGAGYLENESWKLFTGAEGLPVKKFTCSAADKNGSVWFGTEKGAIRTDGSIFRYRFSRRWLADDFVNDIVVDDDGTTWIATNKGVSRIVTKEMTYESKAEYFVEQVETRHNRDGFVATNQLKERFNPDSYQLGITDNDGMYTAMYGASQAFRYAATGDKEAKELAVRSLKACKWLVDITHEPGFPARVIIPADWPEPVNEQYGPEYNKRKQKGDPQWKQISPRFPLSEDGKHRWKCDTSSDELAGHYFFYGIFYDLVAETDEEKQMVRDVTADVTDHLVRNGFLLRDHDGEPTRWGNFSPEFVNSAWGFDQRGLNSMMMLSFLNVAAHVTGDNKYLETAKMLRDKYQYHINATYSKSFYPPLDVVPWDNNLCLMSMYGLINYEEDPELLLIYRKSLEFSWMQISRQKNAFWNLIYAALSEKFNKVVETGVYSSGNVFPERGPFAEFTAHELSGLDYRLNDIMETLKWMPLDLIGYEMDNSHRLDILFDQTPGQTPKKGWKNDGGALPIDERCHVRQDRDAFALIAREGNGYSEHEGTFYLLPYYMARYNGIIK